MALPSEDAQKSGLDDYIIKSLYFVAYRRGCLFPQSLASNSRYGKIYVIPDSTTATDVRSASQEPLQPVVLRADHPIPLYCSVYYFEVTVNVKSRSGILAVGVCSTRSSLNQWPGMEPNSYGYRSNNGAIYHNADELFATGLPYGESDVIGCGINFVNNSIFFTKNGVFMGPITAGKKLPHPVYPCIALASPNCRVSANFGRHKFIFDIGQYMARERAVVVSMAVERKCNDLLAYVTMRNLVASYLLHNGYLETTKALGKWYTKAEDSVVTQEPPRPGTRNGGQQRPGQSYCQTDSCASPASVRSARLPAPAEAAFDGDQEAQQKSEFQRLFSWSEPSHLLLQRRLLMETIRSGDYLRAVKLLEESFPGLAEQVPSIAFVLRCHHFIDLICRQQCQPVARSAPPTGVSRASPLETAPRRHSFVHCPSARQCFVSPPDYSSVGRAENGCQSPSHSPFPVGCAEEQRPHNDNTSVADSPCQVHEHSPTTCHAPMRLRLGGSDDDGQANCFQPAASPKPLPVFPAHQTCCFPSRSEVGGFQHRVSVQEDGPAVHRASSTNNNSNNNNTSNSENNNSSSTSSLYDFSEGQQLHKPDRSTSHLTTGYDSPAAREACGQTLVETSLPSVLGNGIGQHHGIGKLAATSATFFVHPEQASAEMPSNGSTTDNNAPLPEDNREDACHHNDDNNDHHHLHNHLQPYCDRQAVMVVGGVGVAEPLSSCPCPSAEETGLPVPNGNDPAAFATATSQVMINGAGGPSGPAGPVGEATGACRDEDGEEAGYATEVPLPLAPRQPGDSGYDCCPPAAPLTAYDESLLTVVQYGRALRATALELQSRNCITDTQISFLMNAFGLIAYQDPYTSPFRDFLEPNHRDCLADAVNSAIMVHSNQPASPLLNRVLTFLESALTEDEMLGSRHLFIPGGKLVVTSDSTSCPGSRITASAARPTSTTTSAMVTSTVGTGSSNPLSAAVSVLPSPPPPTQTGSASNNPLYASESASTTAPARSRASAATLAQSNIASPASSSALSTHRYAQILDLQGQSRYASRYQLLPIDFHSFIASNYSLGPSVRAVNGTILFPQPDSVPAAPSSSLYIPPSALVSTAAQGGRVRTITTEVTAAAAMEVASRMSPFRRSTWTSSQSTSAAPSSGGGGRSRPVSLQNLTDRRVSGSEPVTQASASSPSGLTPSTPVVVAAGGHSDTASFLSAPPGQTYSSVSSQTGVEAGAGTGRSSVLVSAGYQHHLSESVGLLRGAGAAASAVGGSRSSTIVPEAAHLVPSNTQAPTGPELANFFHPILFTGD